MADWSMYGPESSPAVLMQKFQERGLANQARELEIQKAQKELAEDEELQALLQGMGERPGATPAQMLNEAGTLLLRNGKLNKAEKVLGVSSLITQREAQAQENEAQAKERREKGEVARLESLGQLANLFDDSPEGWRATQGAFLAKYSNPSKLETQILNTPWRKGIGQDLRKRLLSAKGEMVAEHKASTLALSEKSLEERRRHNEILERLSERQRDQADTAEARKEKAAGKKGAKAVGIPTPSNRLDAKAVINANMEDLELPLITDEKTMRLFSQEVASRARELAGQGTEWSDALQQAFDENADRIKTRGKYGLPPEVAEKAKVLQRSEVTPKKEAEVKAPSLVKLPKGFTPTPVQEAEIVKAIEVLAKATPEQAKRIKALLSKNLGGVKID